MPNELTVGTVVTLALGSSVVGAIVTQAATWLREWRGTKRETAYLALRIATIFERFAEDATDVINRIGLFRSGAEEGVCTELPRL